MNNVTFNCEAFTGGEAEIPFEVVEVVGAEWSWPRGSSSLSEHRTRQATGLVLVVAGVTVDSLNSCEMMQGSLQIWNMQMLGLVLKSVVWLPKG